MNDQDHERRPTDEELASIQAEHIADRLAAQNDVIDMERYALRRWLFDEPDTRRLTFGTGNDDEQTIPGDERDVFCGLAIFNDTAASVWFGFASGAARFDLFRCPPHTFMCVPVRYSECSLGVRGADAVAAAFSVTIQRLRVAPLSPVVAPLTG